MRPSGDLGSQCSDPADEQLAGRGYDEMTSRDERIITLSVDGVTLVEEVGMRT